MFQDTKQRQEAEVRSLLDKISPDLIHLDPNSLGQVERDRRNVVMEQREREQDANERRREEQAGKKEKKKARGRNKISKKLARKHKNIVDEGKIVLEQKKKAGEMARGDDSGMSKEERKKTKGVEEGGALARFF
jgi:U3 small nucleolar RNA-associated protein 7